MCTQEGLIDLAFKGPPDQAPAGLVSLVPPAVLHTRRTETVICGHWSALGVCVDEGVIALDGGCVWGHELACLRLEDRKLYTIACR